jgi:hypothetical protein
MSYRKKKLKKSPFSQIKYRFGLAKAALLKFKQKVEGRNDMWLPQTRKIMEWLRNRKSLIRSKNINISSWVSDYVNRCALQGKPVEILTQFCVSKDLEVRYLEQGDTFAPTKKERLLFERDIPQVVNAFRQNGFTVSWWITFNASYIDSGRIVSDIQQAYIEMIGRLAEPLVQSGCLMLADWEADVLGKRPEPNMTILADIERFVQPNLLQLTIDQHSTWARKDAGLAQSDEEIYRDACFKIACEAEEGRYLSSTESPFSSCILVPLEAPERYDCFTLLAPDLKKRIVAVLPLYPWRVKDAD